MRFPRVVAALVLALALCAPAAPARAAFHFFFIAEAFTSADGSVQYFRLHSAAGGQTFMAGQTVTCSNGTTTHTFTFPANLASDTTNADLLVATSNFGSLTGGITPDYTIPANFLFLTGGTLTFSGGSSMTYAALPIDGQHSLAPGNIQMINAPRNFSRQTGSVNVPGGACCNGATCTLSLQSACTGSMTVGASCSPNPCSAPSGTCCVTTTCSVTTQAACTGTWTSGGTCQAGTCEPVGVCCRGSTCVTSNLSECSGAMTGFVATNACNAGSNTTPCCKADFNHINGLSVQDIFDYLNAWFAGSLTADIGGNGAGPLSVGSIFSFLNAWFAGC